MWIANNHIRDDVVRGNVEAYQVEFADALYDYVTKSVALNPRVNLRPGDQVAYGEHLPRREGRHWSCVTFLHAEVRAPPGISQFGL